MVNDNVTYTLANFKSQISNLKFQISNSSVIEKLFASLERFQPLTEEMKERLSSITTIKEFPKKTLLLKEGQVAHNACIVLKGLSRAYYITDGKEITTRFMDEGYIITSWLSYYTQKPG